MTSSRNSLQIALAQTAIGVVAETRMHVEIGECVHACEAIYFQLLNNVCATIYFSRH